MKTTEKQTPSQNVSKASNIALAKRSDFAVRGHRAVCVFALRSAVAAAGGKDAVRMLQVFPAKGEYPGPVTLADGTEVPDAIVVIDDQAYTNLIDAMAADKASAEKDGLPWEGLLIDKEHFSSYADGSSESYGWVKELKLYDDGLFAGCHLNSEGRRVTDEKIYLYRSPDFSLDHIEGKRYRPSRLAAVALTNRPAWTMRPASAARTAANNQTKGNKMKPEEILAKLREILGAEEDTAVIGAVEALQAQITESAEAEADRASDEFIKENEGDIEDPKAFKEAFKKDPETAKALFTAFRRAKPASKPAPRRIDASTVRTRPIVGGSDATDAASAKRTAVQAEVRRLNALGITGTAALQRAELSFGVIHQD